MCGRFILGDSSWAEYHHALSILRPEPATVSYNIKPTQSVPIAYSVNGGLTASAARWWFVPHWHKGDVKDWKATTFNAKIETAHEKPTFRTAWKTGRCIIPASGYYEWTGEKGKKQPWFIGVEANAPVFYFAGLRSVLEDGSETCTILTRASVSQINHLHSRMPVILTSENLASWVEGDMGTNEAIDTLGTDWEGKFRFHAVKKFGILDDGPELIENLKDT